MWVLGFRKMRCPTFLGVSCVSNAIFLDRSAAVAWASIFVSSWWKGWAGPSGRKVQGYPEKAAAFAYSPCGAIYDTALPEKREYRSLRSSRLIGLLFSLPKFKGWQAALL